MRRKARQGTANVRRTLRNRSLRIGIGLAVLFAFGLMASGAFGDAFSIDTIGKTWSQTDTVNVDSSGGFTDQVTLPNTFISNYDVTATDASGLSAATTFTDAAVTLEGQSNPVCTSGGSCDNGWDQTNV